LLVVSGVLHYFKLVKICVLPLFFKLVAPLIYLGPHLHVLLFPCHFETLLQKVTAPKKATTQHKAHHI